METKAQILVVDDESAARSALAELLRDEGYDTRSAADGFKALGVAAEWTPDIILTDLKMPGLDGVGLMEKAREDDPEVAVIVMTAFGSVESAVDAMQKGADDYLTKPVNFDHLLMVLARRLEHRALRREAGRLRELLDSSGPESLVGQAKSFRKTLSVLSQIESSDVPVLLLGESGTGRQSLARLIHERGPRSDQPCISVPCGDLDEETVTAELFGAPATVVAPARPAALARAAGGTLLLEDVDRLPGAVQRRLAEALDSGSFVDDSDGATKNLDLRTIAHAIPDLPQAAASGTFRDDLFYRLGVVNVRVPALRERRDDIPLLAAHFLKGEIRRSGKRLRGFGDRALGIMMTHDWPGNVTQLENCVRHAVAMSHGAEIEPRDLPREVYGNPVDHGMPPIPGSTLYDLERFAILRTLEEVGGSTSKAAKILGISPRKIQYRLNEYRDSGHLEQSA